MPVPSSERFSTTFWYERTKSNKHDSLRSWPQPLPKPWWVFVLFHLLLLFFWFFVDVPAGWQAGSPVLVELTLIRFLFFGYSGISHSSWFAFCALFWAGVDRNPEKKQAIRNNVMLTNKKSNYFLRLILRPCFLPWLAISQHTSEWICSFFSLARSLFVFFCSATCVRVFCSFCPCSLYLRSIFTFLRRFLRTLFCSDDYGGGSCSCFVCSSSLIRRNLTSSIRFAIIRLVDE